MAEVTTIQLCGRLVAVVDGHDITDKLESRPARELFAFLAINRLQPVSIDGLRSVFAILDDDNFAQAMSRVRAAVGQYLEDDGDIQLRLPVGSQLDIEAAAEAVHRAEASLARQEWGVAWPAARTALHIARRTFLPGADALWVTSTREKLRGIEVRAHECVASIGLGMGGTEVAAADRSGRALMLLDPTRESGYRFAMEAAARGGNEAEAVVIYNRLRTRLQNELGVEPGITSRELLRRVTGESVAAKPDAEPASVSVMRTFMFTDIEASTPLLAAVGDEAWANLVIWHDRTLRACFGSFRGEEVDHAGDGFFVAFASTTDAIACAVAVQRALEAHRHEHGFAPQVRIGLHSDYALTSDGKYLGRSVHAAARIGGLARGGEIVASAVTIADSDVPTTQTRSASLKGLDEPIEVVTVEWRQLPR